MRTSKRLRSIRTIIDELLQQYFKFGTESSKKVEDFELGDVENPCHDCLVFPLCQTECSESAAYKLLEYLEKLESKPETCLITATQKKKRG